MARHPNSLKNLRPFKAGKSGNPSGRAKEADKPMPTLRDWQEFALESAGVDKNGKVLPSRDSLVMRALFLVATDRRRKDITKGISIWLDRTRGRVPDKIEHSGEIDTGNDPIAEYLAKLVVEQKKRESDEKAKQKAAGDADTEGDEDDDSTEAGPAGK
jgi:hypothetical protein